MPDKRKFKKVMATLFNGKCVKLGKLDFFHPNIYLDRSYCKLRLKENHKTFSVK
jgi:hypothetical protein